MQLQKEHGELFTQSQRSLFVQFNTKVLRFRQKQLRKYSSFVTYAVPKAPGAEMKSDRNNMTFVSSLMDLSAPISTTTIRACMSMQLSGQSHVYVGMQMNQNIHSLTWTASLDRRFQHSACSSISHALLLQTSHLLQKFHTP